MQPLRSAAPLTDLRRVSLNFTDRRLETAYRHYLSARPLHDARLVLVFGLVFYALLGLLDPYFLPDPDHSAAWLIRAIVLLFGMIVLLFTFHSLFRGAGEVAVALTGIVAAAGLTGVMSLMPANALAEYYVSIILVIFWTYFFPGLRFVNGLWANVAIVAVFYAGLWYMGYLPEHLLAGSAYFFAAASVLAAAEAYARERRRRMYFERANRSPRETHAPDLHPLHDRLTGLPNRGLLADRLDQAIVVSRRDAKKCAGFYIDLDDFSAANATLGRDAGDEILQVVAQRLRQMMRESDTIARLEDDKFFVVTRDVDSIDVAKSIADRLLACVEQPVPLYRGSTVELRASIGICLFPYADCTADDIVYRAEVALGLAKQAGKHRYAFADPGQPSAQRVV